MITLVQPTHAQWEVLRDLGLTAPGSGCILLGPDLAQQLRDEGYAIDELAAIDYDFGGEADIWLDVVTSSAHYAVEVILRELAADEADDEGSDSGLEP